MITVHHLDNSRSQRILWLLEELGVPYEIQRYQRDPATMLAPPALRAVHPLGKSPVITDGAVTVAESGAIIEYLVDRHGQGRLIPAPGTPERLRYTYWLHYAEGSAMPPLLLKLIFDRIESTPMPFFVTLTRGTFPSLAPGTLCSGGGSENLVHTIRVAVCESIRCTGTALYLWRREVLRSLKFLIGFRQRS